MKETAIEWLIYQISPYICDERYANPLIEQAKQMEKEQIIEAFDCDGTPQPGEKWISNGEQYYNETYGK